MRVCMHTHTHTPHKPRCTQVTEGWPQHSPGPQGWEIQNWGESGGTTQNTGTFGDWGCQ